MIERCYKSNSVSYRFYGKRDIKVCEQWLDSKYGLLNFYIWAYNNGYEPELTIERKDSNKNYEPENCKWATPKEQANNTRKNVFITYKNKTLTISQWADLLKINYKCFWWRIKKWGEKEAIERSMKNE